MNKNLSFAENRLNQLTDQLLSETSVTGSIVFFADEEAGGISGATWRFDEEDHTFLKESGYKLLLMELLDILIQHRASEGDADTLCGLVHLDASSPEIHWLTSEEAEKRRFSD